MDGDAGRVSIHQVAAIGGQAPGPRQGPASQCGGMSTRIDIAKHWIATHPYRA